MTNNEAPPVQRALVTATPLKKKIQFFTDGSVSRYRRLCFIKKKPFSPSLSATLHKYTRRNFTFVRFSCVHDESLSTHCQWTDR